MLTSNEFEGDEAINENENEKTQRWIEENDRITQSWTNLIFSSLFILIVAFISYFIGIDVWIRKNSVWLVLFVIILVELDCIGSIDRLWLFIKRNSKNEHEDLMEKLGQLVIDVDYIKNTVKELKERK